MLFTMTHKTWDLRLVFLLLCGAGVIVPSCGASCDITDVEKCLPGIFGTNDINSFHCNEGGRTCIHMLKLECAGRQSYRVISQVAAIADYSCTPKGQKEQQAYTDCLTDLGTATGGTEKLTTFTNAIEVCSADLERNIGSSDTLDAVCSASTTFKSCFVSAFNALCQGTGARSFFGQFAEIIEVGGCFNQIGDGASIPHMTKLFMAIWAAILTIFFL